jgi:hypothetical protein
MVSKLGSDVVRFYQYAFDFCLSWHMNCSDWCTFCSPFSCSYDKKKLHAGSHLPTPRAAKQSARSPICLPTWPYSFGILWNSKTTFWFLPSLF